MRVTVFVTLGVYSKFCVNNSETDMYTGFRESKVRILAEAAGRALSR
jgi:hypothetical protein